MGHYACTVTGRRLYSAKLPNACEWLLFLCSCTTWNELGGQERDFLVLHQHQQHLRYMGRQRAWLASGRNSARLRTANTQGFGLGNGIFTNNKCIIGYGMEIKNYIHFTGKINFSNVHIPSFCCTNIFMKMLVSNAVCMLCPDTFH